MSSASPRWTRTSNVWLEQRLTERRALTRIIDVLDSGPLGDGASGVQAPARPPAPPSRASRADGSRQPDNLRAAAQRKRAEATARAEAALAELVARHQPVTFRGLAKAAGVSVDFLYRSPLRARIEELRATAAIAATTAGAEHAAVSDSQVVRALAAQLRDLKRRHHDEITELRNALAAAHGENLELRRRLGPAAARQAAAQ